MTRLTRAATLLLLLVLLGATKALAQAPEAKTTVDEAAVPTNRVTALDRVEFVSFQLAYGAVDGLAFSSINRDYGYFPLVAEVSIRGLGAALWSGLCEDCTASQGMIINAATFWAHIWSVLLTYALEGNRGPYPAHVGMLAGFAGTLVGARLGSLVQPDPGALALANSGAAWAALLAYFTRVGVSRTQAEWKTTFTIIDVASVSGYALGLLVSRIRLPNRASVFIIDLCGVLGAAAGFFLTARLGASVITNPRLFSLAVSGFTAVGVGLGTALTLLGARPPANLPTFSLTPTNEGLGLTVQAAF